MFLYFFFFFFSYSFFFHLLLSQKINRKKPRRIERKAQQCGNYSRNWNKYLHDTNKNYIYISFSSTLCSSGVFFYMITISHFVLYETKAWNISEWTNHHIYSNNKRIIDPESVSAFTHICVFVSRSFLAICVCVCVPVHVYMSSKNALTSACVWVSMCACVGAVSLCACSFAACACVECALQFSE